MAGGAGERFWPVSRADKPKYLCSFKEGEKCLLMQTFLRASKVVPSSNIFVLTNKAQVQNILEACPELPSGQIFAEPALMDTSAAIAYAVSIIGQKTNFQDSSFAVLPSDAAIKDVGGFADTLTRAFNVAEAREGGLVTIGIPPTFPATGYGYIQKAERFDAGGGEYFRVAHFYEKPSEARARSYLESGDFYWNAGLFVWKTSSIASAIKKYAPKIGETLGDILRGIKSGLSAPEAAGKYYGNFEKISIDFSVMEKADNVWTVPARFDWDDVGSWGAVERLGFNRDESGNIAVGEAVFEASSGNVLFDKSSRLTAFFGVDNIVVVHTPDATLVCDKSCADKLKALVKKLPQKCK